MTRLRSRLLAFAVPAAALAVVAAGTARAQVDEPLPTLPTTTTAPPSTSSTTAPPPSTTPTTRGNNPTSTTAPPPSTSPGPTTAPPPGGGDGPDAGSGGVIPPDAQAVINSIKRTPSNNTRQLLAALRPLLDLGFTEAEAVQLGFGRFPVGGEAVWSDDWYFPRFVPSFHFHEGTDIFAAEGTPVRSPVDGILKQSNGSIGGLAAYVYEPNGSYHYLAHLTGFVPGQVTGQAVKAGEVVGYNGTSGNAKGTSPHVHYEYHPAPTKTVTTGKGKKAVTTTHQLTVPMGTQLPPSPPKPLLDAWVAEALANVPKVIAQAEAGRPRAIIATGLTRRLADGGSSQFAAPSGPPRTQLLWASSASPSGGALRLAEAEAFAMADEVDYAVLAREEEEKLRAHAAEQQWAATVFKPLTAPALQAALGYGPPAFR
ncbi:MAG TPA: M23 family metallopeptidase [Acidimicrobiales bacterium]|nr:M23 family metallopeptidase [Acidimicrobiales bacterium]